MDPTSKASASQIPEFANRPPSQQQTIPIDGDDLESPPPYQPSASFPSSSAGATSSTPAGTNSNGRRAASPSGYVAPAPLRVSNDPLATGSGSGSGTAYRPVETMSMGHGDTDDVAAKYAAMEEEAGCCCSESGGCMCSDHGGCFFSSNGACCFSDNGGCCFSDHGACCFSDNGGCCWGDHGGACFSSGKPAKK